MHTAILFTFIFKFNSVTKISEEDVMLIKNLYLSRGMLKRMLTRFVTDIRLWQILIAFFS